MVKDLITQLKDYYLMYASEHRSSVQPVKLSLANEHDLHLNFEDKIVRESLIEHVGHLPVTATLIFPHLNEPEVNLGDALIMLAIHDIGELELGDHAIFIKSNIQNDEEKKVALKMLDKIYHEKYLDMEEQKTKTGKFAKSIDKVVADILDLVVPKEVSIARYESMGVLQNQIVPKKREKKMHYMLWNPFLANFYEALLSELEIYFAD